jgi:hypothetical protein
MSPLKRILGVALASLLAFPSPRAAFASDDAAGIKTPFLNGDPLPAAVSPGNELYEAAADIQKGPRAEEEASVFSTRIDIVGEKLALDADELAQAKSLYSKKRRRPAGQTRSSALRVLDMQAARRQGMTASAARLASRLGTGPAAESLVGGRPAAGGSPSPRGEQAALIAPLNVQETRSKGLVTHDVPKSENPDVLHALGDATVAPPATIAMRYNALFSDKAAVAQDLSTVRAKAETLQLPADGHTGLASSQASLDEFVSWVKSAPAGELPNISYGVLNAGEIGRYQRNIVRKSAITINISVKDAEPQARAAVLFHELYHYWDVEVAKNHYGNVSYGFIDPAHMPEHELDAYYMTALMWSQNKPDGAKSPLAQFLGRLPTDRDQVQAMVESSLGQIKK